MDAMQKYNQDEKTQQQLPRSRSSSSSTSVLGGALNAKERLSLKLELGLESTMLDVQPDSPPGTHTHQWTVFLRLSNGQQFEPNFLQKVVFQLHEDFPNSKRST